MRDRRKKFRGRLSLLLTVTYLFSILFTTAGQAAYGDGYAGGMQGEGRGIYAYGIDISSWQGHEVDFYQIKAEGYDFVILRAGFATTEDNTFEENYIRAKDAGLDVGVYLYSYADTVSDALDEAAALKTWLAGKKLEYPVYFDLEDPQKHAGLDSAFLTQLSAAFLDSMAEDGWLCGLYSSKSWLDYKVDAAALGEKYECWMAMYLPSGYYENFERYDAVYGMWQYSSTGVVGGVPGNCDMNIAFKDYPSICRNFGFNGYTVQTEPISLYDLEAPELLVQGTHWQLAGGIASYEGNLLEVTATLTDSANEVQTGGTLTLAQPQFDLDQLNELVKTETLAAGAYTLRVGAKTEHAAYTLLQQPVTVSRTGAVLSEAATPSDRTVGEDFQPSGLIRAGSPLLAVSVCVRGDEGTVMLNETAEPYATEYDLSNLDVAMSQMLPGAYYYEITATTEYGTEELSSTPFMIWSGGSTVHLNDFSMKERYAYRELKTLGGTVVSDGSKLRRLTVTVTRGDGETFVNYTARDLGGAVELNNLRGKLNLSRLTAGSYTLRIVAVNENGPAILTDTAFRVGYDGVSLCGASLPEVVTQGDSFRIAGVLASETTPLRYVGASILDARGIAVQTAYANVQRGVFSLEAFADQLELSALPIGEYRLILTAENGSSYQTVCDRPFTVAKNENIIRWESGHFTTDGLTYPAGGSVEFWGTLISALPISKVVAVIRDADGKLMATAVTEPDAVRFSVGELSSLLKTAALPVGAYTLSITAYNSTGSFRVAFERFRTSSCTHTAAVMGQGYTPSCICEGIVCDGWCEQCGGSVSLGTVMPRQEHDFRDGVCSQCGITEPQTVRATLSKTLPQVGRTYLLTFYDGQSWYALANDGSTVTLSIAPQNGALDVPETLLWRAGTERDALCLRDADGDALHLDTEGLAVAGGSSHTALQFGGKPDRLTVRSAELNRYLTFADGSFDVGTAATVFRLFEVVQNG